MGKNEGRCQDYTTIYILVLVIGVELLLEEFGGVVFADWVRFSISAGILLFSVLYAHSKLLQKFRPLLVWAAQGFANFNEVFDWLLVPFGAAFRWLRGLFQPKRPAPVIDLVPPIDYDLLRRAQALCGLNTTNEVINKALALMVGEKDHFIANEAE
ncbi:MAG: hypothetical protein IH586_22870 [Anaerolineaceae bacterium]|nr:hypothetical protein [Anaerolineaceae bacterium]